MRRGEVWLADLPPPSGRRPVVLVSREDAYAARDLVLVAPVTLRVRCIPAEVPLGPEDGLLTACVANLDTILTVSTGVLERRLATLRPAKLRAIDAAIRFAFGLEPYP